MTPVSTLFARLRADRWQSKSDVVDMLDQVQRVQIRRIERDAFETDELVKRCLNILDRRGGGGGGSRRGGPSGSSGSDRGGDRIAGVRRRSVVSRPGSVRPSSRRASTTGGRFREAVERETMRTRPEGGIRPRDGEASNMGRRRERSPRPRYEYEVVQPGRIYVDDDRSERRGEEEYVERRSAPRRSYSRDRGRDRHSVVERGSSRERRRD